VESGEIENFKSSWSLSAAERRDACSSIMYFCGLQLLRRPPDHKLPPERPVTMETPHVEKYQNYISYTQGEHKIAHPTQNTPFIITI